MPMTNAPEGSLQTGLRTVGGNFPATIPASAVSSRFLQRSASQGINFSSIHFDFARCSAGDFTPPQQSIGPPGTPSNTMISQWPLVVSAGKTKYSPTPGIKLKETAVNGLRGSIPFT